MTTSNSIKVKKQFLLSIFQFFSEIFGWKFFIIQFFSPFSAMWAYKKCLWNCFIGPKSLCRPRGRGVRCSPANVPAHFPSYIILPRYAIFDKLSEKIIKIRECGAYEISVRIHFTPLLVMLGVAGAEVRRFWGNSEISWILRTACPRRGGSGQDRKERASRRRARD